MGFLQQLCKSALGLTREDRDAEVKCLLNFRCNIRQHCKAAAHVKATDAYGHAGRAQWSCDVDGARILVRLNTDQRHQSACVACLDGARNLLRSHARVDLVLYGDLDLHLVA